MALANTHCILFFKSSSSCLHSFLFIHFGGVQVPLSNHIIVIDIRRLFVWVGHFIMQPVFVPSFFTKNTPFPIYSHSKFGQPHSLFHLEDLWCSEGQGLPSKDWEQTAFRSNPSSKTWEPGARPRPLLLRFQSTWVSISTFFRIISKFE